MQLFFELFLSKTQVISGILTKLLTVFHTEELSLETVDREVETVRQQIYDRQKHESHI
jgi:predicted DNA-binding protein YlxM (UPF0122 family)